MRQEARKLAELVRKQEKVRIVTHIDADGICAGAVAATALERAGVPFEVEFVKQLDPETVERLRSSGQTEAAGSGQRTAGRGQLAAGSGERAAGTTDPCTVDEQSSSRRGRPFGSSTALHPAPGTLIWFTDLGSGQLELLKGLDCVITDHHTPSGETDIPSVNPHNHGLSGALELSGAGAAYLVARELDAGNADLAALAVVGAVGDMQDGQHCRLTGLNREIMEEGRRAGVLDWGIDLRYFGRETRPVHKMLQYSSDPAVPGITGSEEGALALLQSLGIPLKDGERWRSWSELDGDEKSKVASALVRRALSNGVGHRMAKRMLGEVYTLTAEMAGTELRDAKEYATLLNSCGRHDKAPLGLKVCCGDRSEMLERALGLLQGHRRSLVEGIQFVKESGIEKRRHLQHFHAGRQIQDTIVGVVAGMLLGSGEAGADPSLPIIAFANAEEGTGIKVSARAARALVEKGLDLSDVMKIASASVGGTGGGHNVAAGGMIPEGTEERFLDEAERLIRDQLCRG